MIYTCYSYKGGVGRSMALANIAELLYAKGLRVLMIDFDLEAPGLEQYFYKKAEPALKKVLSQRGIIDLLMSYKELRSLPLPRPSEDKANEATSHLEEEPNSPPTDDLPADETFPYPVEPLDNFIWEIHPRSTRNPGELLLMPAGRRMREVDASDGESVQFKDDFASYADHVRAFGWDDFYINWDGEQFFNWFYEKVIKRAQVVLIDSRTGVAEMSGVCTYQLADVVVMFVAPNNQNLDGTKKIAGSLVRREDLVRKRYQQRKLSVIFVPSRVDSSEKEKVDDLAIRFRELASRLASPDLTFEADTFTDLTIPYIPYYSFVEELVARDTVSPAAINLKKAYENICRTLAQFDSTIKARMSEQVDDPSRVNVAERQNRMGEHGYANLKPDQQKAARSVFTRLVRLALPEEGERKDTPKDIKRADLTSEQLGIASVLEKEGLLVLAKDTAGQETAGLAEEGLIQNWKRFQQWIDEDREFLTWRQYLQSALSRWEKKGRGDSDLLAGSRLEEAEKWFALRWEDLNNAESNYVLKSIALRDQKRRDRRLQLVGMVLGAILVSLTVYYLYQKNRQQNILDARSRQLASNSGTLVALEPELSALLAIEASRVAPTSEAQRALTNAWQQPRLQTEMSVGAPVHSARFSHDGKRMVTGSGGGTSLAQIWQQGAGNAWQNLIILRGHKGDVTAAAFSPDDRIVATASYDATVILWNAESGQMIGSLKAGPGSLTDLDWSPDGQLVAAAAQDNQVYVWEVKSQKLLQGLKAFTDNVNSVAFSPNGQLLAAGSKDTQVRVWNVQSWQEPTTAIKGPLKGHQAAVLSVRFSSDSKLLVTAGADNTARIWEISDWRTIAVLSGHFGTVNRAAFSPDGKLVATASEENTVIVWETATRNRVAMMRGSFGSVNDASFSSDGKLILTGSGDGVARIWELSPAANPNSSITELAASVCTRLTRNMTQAEWRQYMGSESYRSTCPNIQLPQPSAARPRPPIP